MSRKLTHARFFHLTTVFIQESLHHFQLLSLQAMFCVEFHKLNYMRKMIFIALKILAASSTLSKIYIRYLMGHIKERIFKTNVS